MSLDHTVYVKTRRKSLRSVRRAAEAVLARRQGLSLHPVEDERDEDELWIGAFSGPIEVATYGFGVGLSISSTTGARECFAELGDLAEEIGEELGKVLDEETALELIGAEDAEHEPERPPPSKPHGKAILLVDRVEVLLLGADGETLTRTTTSIPQFNAQRDDSGKLLPKLRMSGTPAVLTEEGRLSYAASRLCCTLHGSSGSPVCRYEYDLDAHGRVTAAREIGLTKR